MGIVYEGHDANLDRTVAVKRVRQDIEHTDEKVASLLAEARITGAVTHPNIIPIHDVRLGDDGEAEILLKRIHGRPWSELLRDPLAVARRHGATDPLLFHVEVLEQIAAALHAAHVRGIIHRDVKPGNVMIGDRGEAYLLDWGVAVTLAEDADSRLPRPPEEARGAGTPQFMAPEMASKRYGELGPWSDVYLLGGTLYSVLFGGPPHHGSGSIWNLLVQVCEKGITVPDEGPIELVDLCRRCLQRRPEDRIQDAETVRRALRTWIDHRGSNELADEGRTQEALMTALSAERALGELDESLHMQVQARFGAAVFAYRRALEAWPDNPSADEGLLRVVRFACDEALLRGDVGSAETALAQHPSPPDDLANRVHEAVLHPSGPDSLPAAVAGTIALGLAMQSWAPLLYLGLGGDLATWLLAADLGALVGIGAAVAVTMSDTGSARARRVAATAVLAAATQALLVAGARTWTLDPDALLGLHLAVLLLVLTASRVGLGSALPATAGLAAIALGAAIALPAAAPFVAAVACAGVALTLLLSARG